MNWLKGTGVALVTPFNNDGSIDYTALENLINHCLTNGVNYLVTLGTTGETPVLSLTEKKEIANFTINIANKRCPVVIGAGGNYTQQVLHELTELPINQADAVLSASPYYNKPTQAGIIEHYKQIATHSSKPIILYNVPGRTGSNMVVSTTLALAQVKNIAAIKEASGNMSQCMAILSQKPTDFVVLSGDDNLVLPQIACGMKGVISVAANALPKTFTAMVNQCLQNNFAEAKVLNDKLLPAYDLLFEENNPGGVKAFLTELGIVKNNFRLPVVPVSAGLQARIKQYIQMYEA
jgi:4-hydroxy-tetrahydrodipicolinate synthase